MNRSYATLATPSLGLVAWLIGMPESVSIGPDEAIQWHGVGWQR